MDKIIFSWPKRSIYFNLEGLHHIHPDPSYEEWVAIEHMKLQKRDKDKAKGKSFKEEENKLIPIILSCI